MLDAEGQYVKSNNIGAASATNSSSEDNKLKEAISDTNVPAPPENNDTGTDEGNDMESEGITNEEAGLE